MQIGTYQFRPNLYMTIIVLIFTIPLLLSLGFWQLDRAEEKRGLGETINQRNAMPAHNLTQQEIPADQAEHRQVAAQGRYLFTKQILIENRKHQGKRGYHVITPFYIEQLDRYLLVNRGWIEKPSDTTTNINTPTTNQPSHVSGIAVIPKPPAIDLKFTPVDNKSWPYLTLNLYSQWSGLKLFPFLLLQDKNAPLGYERNWPRLSSNDAMHLGYAIQWFAFAIIAFCIWFALSLKKPTTDGAIHG